MDRHSLQGHCRDLQAEGALVEMSDYSHNVVHATAVAPPGAAVSKQWFVAMSR